MREIAAGIEGLESKRFCLMIFDWFRIKTGIVLENLVIYSISGEGIAEW